LLLQAATSNNMAARPIILVIIIVSLSLSALISPSIGGNLKPQSPNCRPGRQTFAKSRLQKRPDYTVTI
jgi:hypothetical protein